MQDFRDELGSDEENLIDAAIDSSADWSAVEAAM
jgi:hypothetical protein